MGARAVVVALPLPLQSTFTYGVPDGMECPSRGVRALVPFGARRVIGVVAKYSACAHDQDAGRRLARRRAIIACRYRFVLGRSAG